MTPTGKEFDVRAAAERLAEAAESGETIEVILVVRGKVRPVGGPNRRRWRMRVDGDHVLTFRAESVVAATSVKNGRGR